MFVTDRISLVANAVLPAQADIDEYLDVALTTSRSGSVVWSNVSPASPIYDVCWVQSTTPSLNVSDICNKDTSMHIRIYILYIYPAFSNCFIYIGGQEQKLRLQTPSNLDIDLVRRQQHSTLYYTAIVISSFGMESSTKFPQTATRFSELPQEILLCITNFADPETCFSLLQVTMSSL